MKRTLGRVVRIALADALDAAAVAHQLAVLYRDEGASDMQVAQLGRLVEPLRSLCRTLDTAAQQTRVGSGAGTAVRLPL